MVFEDGLVHIIDGLIRKTGGGSAGADRRRGAQRSCEHARAGAFRRRLLWPRPRADGRGFILWSAACAERRRGNDRNSLRVRRPAGALTRPAAPARLSIAGFAPRETDIRVALEGARLTSSLDVASAMHRTIRSAGSPSPTSWRYVTASDGVLAISRDRRRRDRARSGHRSILANACNPRTLPRLLTGNVKYARPISGRSRPWLTLAAAKALVRAVRRRVGQGSTVNAYNYMVLTARAKNPSARPTSRRHPRRWNCVACRSCASIPIRELRLFQGARSTPRGRGCGEYVLQRRGSDRADRSPAIIRCDDRRALTVYSCSRGRVSRPGPRNRRPEPRRGSLNGSWSGKAKTNAVVELSGVRSC